MALTRLTNKRDKYGNLVNQIIITDEEESFIRKAANEEAIKAIKNDHALSGAPDSEEKRRKQNYNIERVLWTYRVANGLVATGIIVGILNLLGLQIK